MQDGLQMQKQSPFFSQARVDRMRNYRTKFSDHEEHSRNPFRALECSQPGILLEERLRNAWGTNSDEIWRSQTITLVTHPLHPPLREEGALQQTTIAEEIF